ncbi:kinase suppressor of Ras 1-like [Mytilus galloprovincialis]|uniref:Kinase suppressor of Ras 2 n=1 Tax=Mytilus galloprovincialis TaxID=29158 RepID=A0A8B6HIC0_MYTGA|nr:kinase suppressor of Ras 2 [Mytilus galloprovincialis]
MASSITSLVHPSCTQRCSLKRRRSHRSSKYTSNEAMKGEEHWTKVLQTKEQTAFYKNRCACKKSPNLNSLVRHRSEGAENIFPSVFRRFYLWINSRVKSHSTHDHDKVFIPEIQTLSGSDSGCETDIISNTHPVLIRTQKLQLDLISINDADDPNYVYIRNNKSADASPSLHPFSSIHNSFSNINEVLTDDNKKNFLTLSVGESGSRQNLTVTRSAPSQSQRTSRVAEPVCKIKPYHTWPLSRKVLEQKEEEKSTVFDNLENRSMYRNPSAEDLTNLKEFSIPYEDLEFTTCFRTGRDRVIYRGKWHGDVNIHYYGSYTALDFWHLVTKMQRVRHENVALFMGSCTDFNKYSIIESIQDGVSLYEHIHIQKEVSSMQSKIQLLRQISHGMGYLHAKGIVVKNLNTRNIFLCPKARVSVMDYGIVEPQHDREGLACVPRGYLTYMAPEILRTLMIDPPIIYMKAECTKESDVFAFGTIVYELVTWRYPFFGQLPESIIWRICTNQYEEIDKIKSAKAMKRLMELCWSFDPGDRPSFANISKDLNRTISLHKRHSISEPDILSRFGSISCC